ncbi:MAG: flgF [Rhizobacter sp.]|jgi:flagellar basal-body rod protein FlgF|nr:flgF [Rhizobacter sp.]
MDRMIYLSMSGAKATMQRQDTLANNLANASTVGFRAELQAFRSVPIEGDGASTRVFSLETTPGYDSSQGPLQQTGKNLDVAMKGDAWLAVQALDGTEAYTRAGSMEVNADGTLVTPGGLQVLGDGGPITIPQDADIAIAADGTISARDTAGKTTPVGKLKMVTPETNLIRGDDTLFRAADNAPLDADPAARLQSGALEGSNVSAVQTMVSMISAARQFETQMKLMQTAEADDKAAGQLLNISG